MKLLLLIFACATVVVLAKPASPLDDILASTGLSLDQLKELFKAQKEQKSASSEEGTESPDAPEEPSVESEEEVSPPPQGVPAARPRPETRKRESKKRSLTGLKTEETTPLSVFNIA